MAVPSIKGSVFQTVVESVVKLMDQGVLDRADVERKLPGTVYDLLSETIGPAMWYPVEAYRELTDLLTEAEGNGDDQYMFNRGAASAERLIEGGLYQQVTFADEQGGNARDRLESVARLIVTIAPSMFNFTKWSIEINPDDRSGFTIRVVEAEDLPECLRLSSAGFAHTLAERALGKIAQNCERVSASVIVMTHNFVD